MPDNNYREQIKNKLLELGTDLHASIIDFWETLGYRSNKPLPADVFTIDDLQDILSVDFGKLKFRRDSEPISKIDSLSLLFQYAKDDLQAGQQKELDFSTNAIDRRLFNSYIFLAIDLKKEQKVTKNLMQAVKVTKKDYVDITREINKLLPMPIIIIFRHLDSLTVAIIDRRLGARDRQKKVLEKVTLIKDVNLQKPHRGHLDILNKLHLDNLQVSNIESLHKAWRKQLSVKELNQQFYKEITAWYKSSYELVQLFYTAEYTQETKDEIKKHFLVKLVCRLMFCWFIKEKGLIPAQLLELTTDTGDRYSLTCDDEDPESNSYYRGILRTLFFECLNTPGTKRNFQTLKDMKYISNQVDIASFKQIPYLNGGIFDIFDEFLEDNAKLDNNISDDLVSIPNKIFYGWVSPTRRASDNIPGLNEILSRYKFTVEENTPLEEDVALDPELLGMVFENLLAELDPDPEIAKNARKNSGSFYTPREVIDFMVNDSLVLYLQNYAQAQDKNYTDQIKFLVYHEVTNVDSAFDDFVVEALDKLRVLDPACGSGAFPMGMLHKMTRMLHLVDEKNKKWIQYKLKSVDKDYKDEFAKNLEEHYENYPRKIGIIRDSIYGADIQPLAGHIAKLRFFISLIVDQDTSLKKENCGVTPLPNLETNIICVDSLKQLPLQMDFQDVSQELIKASKQYYDFHKSPGEKDKLLDEIATYLSLTFEDFCWNSDQDSPERNHEFWKRWFHFGNKPCPFFDYEVFFPQVAACGGFDIIIGNPPYGGKNIDEEVKDILDIGSRDPYGAFIARFLNFPGCKTPLKENGILAYIVSDTFMTIKSHKDLRKQMLENYIHKMVRMHPDTFKQVVNTAVILCQKASEKQKIPDKHHCLMVDMTNISIHKDLDKFLEILYDIEETDKVRQHSDKVYAIFKYYQNIIKKSTLIPFFVAPAKLFSLMYDVGVTRNDINNTERDVKINEKKVILVKLGDIAAVSKGIDTGENSKYLFQRRESGNHYRTIEDFFDYVITNEDLEYITKNEVVRDKIIELGFHKSEQEELFDIDRWFGGRYIIPYDKGAAADTEMGWLPNYNVPTYYYIDWSSWAVNRMKTLTRRMRDGTNSDVLCATFRNKSTFFKKGITYSITGQYAPTFRISSGSLYDNKGSMILLHTDEYNIECLLGILCSKLVKMLSKSCIYHAVDMQVDAIKEIPISKNVTDDIITHVKAIIEKQEKNADYPYFSKEQIEIDRLVYEMYGLNDADILEVENWYARRYPRLVRDEVLADS